MEHRYNKTSKIKTMDVMFGTTNVNKQDPKNLASSDPGNYQGNITGT